jgi:putative oxidoreductase
MIRSLAKLQPWALTLLRLTLGVSMLVHGWEKLIPAGGLHRAHPLAGFEVFNHFVATLGLPYWLGYVSIVTEFCGGIFLIFGLLTRFWAFMILGNMLVALWTVDRHQGYAGSEYTLALISMALMLVVAGSGALALDRRLGIS